MRPLDLVCFVSRERARSIEGTATAKGIYYIAKVKVYSTGRRSNVDDWQVVWCVLSFFLFWLLLFLRVCFSGGGWDLVCVFLC